MPQFGWHEGLRKFIFKGSKSFKDRMEEKLSECEDLLIKAKKVQIRWGRSKLREFISYEIELGRTAAYELIKFMIENEQIKEIDDGTLEICV